MGTNTVETLTSRERVQRAIRHQPVDRMPIDLGCHFSTGISAFAYTHLREYLGLPYRVPEIIDPSQFLARVEKDVLQRLHCDCMLLHPGWKATHEWRPRGDYRFNIPWNMHPRQEPDGAWVVGDTIMRMPAGGFFFENGWVGFPDEEDPDAMLLRTAREAERIFKETDYYTMYIGYGAYFGDIEYQCRMYTDPDEIHIENARALEADLHHVARVIDLMGDYVQAIATNSDLGSQSAPFVRPSLYEELCAPYLRKFCEFVHRHSDCAVFMHSCGAIEPLIPILIDCGVDILNPVQISADTMHPQQLKTQYGDRVTFWGGGCNTQHVLPSATVEEVEENVRMLVNTFKPGSGYIFNPVHNIMGDIAPEKIVAMYDTAYAESW